MEQDLVDAKNGEEGLAPDVWKKKTNQIIRVWQMGQAVTSDVGE